MSDVYMYGAGGSVNQSIGGNGGGQNLAGSVFPFPSPNTFMYPTECRDAFSKIGSVDKPVTFKVGDKVRLREGGPDTGMKALSGAEAVVANLSGLFLVVDWIPSPKVKTQEHGQYFSYRFDLVEEVVLNIKDRIRVTFEADYVGPSYDGSYVKIDNATYYVPRSATIEVIEPAKPSVKEALAALPVDPDKIAILFGQKRIKGIRQVAPSCPVARYLSQETGRKTKVTHAETGFDDNYETNPAGVKQFVKNFDKGDYPWLDEATA